MLQNLCHRGIGHNDQSLYIHSNCTYKLTKHFSFYRVLKENLQKAYSTWAFNQNPTKILSSIGRLIENPQTFHLK